MRTSGEVVTGKTEMVTEDSSEAAAWVIGETAEVEGVSDCPLSLCILEERN